MPPRWKDIAYTSLLVLWLGVFSWEGIGLQRAETAVKRTTEHLDLQGHQLDEGTRELDGTLAQSGELGKEMGFLQSLVNILPEEKGFVRTQKAIGEDVEALRRKVGKRLGNQLHLLIDTKANKLYVKEGLALLWEADCSVGRGGVLIDKTTGRRWEFVTPRGQFEVRSKIENPLWTKPDWAFVETGEAVPPPEDPARRVPGELGAYVLNLGDGYLIHGTKNEALLGHPVSHGCVRLGADNLKKLYETVPKGTRVYIY